MGKILLAIFCIVLLLGFAGTYSDGIHDWRSDDIAQTASVTTAAGETTASVVLSRELYADDVTQIHTLSSSIAETPIAGTYTTATKTLQLTNLTAAQTRTITLGYYSEKEDEILKAIGPFLIPLIFLLIFGAIAYMLFKKKGGR